MNKQINKPNAKNFVAVKTSLWHRLLCHTLVLSVFMASFSSEVFSQTESFDIISYKPLSSAWKKEMKPGVVNFTHVNAGTGSFCVIAMYASSASTGDAQNDFTNQWNDLVVTPYRAAANPKTETQTTADGWKAVVGAAPVKIDEMDVYVILTVFSGFGKTVSIRSSLNNQSYTAEIDALLEKIKLDKTKGPFANNNNTGPVKMAGGAGQFGLMNYTAPAGWKEQKFQDGVVFKPSDLPAGDLLAIQIMQPLHAAVTLEQALPMSYNDDPLNRQ